MRSVNSYYGRSNIKLLIYNLWHFLSFFKRRGPSKSLMEPTKRAKNSKQKSTCLLIGSGPSLDKLNPKLAKISFDDVIVTNSYYKYKFSDVLIPKYYCLSDPNFFVETDKVKFHDNLELLNYLKKHTPTLLVSHFYRNHEIIKQFNTIFYDDRELPRFFGGSISPMRPRNYVSLTLYKALAMAIHLGYDSIYLIGMDNSEFLSYRSNANNEIRRESSIYFADTMQWNDMPAFSNPEILPGGIAGQLQTLAIFFGDLLKFSGHQVFNLDEESLVDAFPKITKHPSISKKTS